MSKQRVVRFCYLSSDSRHKGRRYQHQLRDGDAAIELMPILASLGYEYGGVFINWPKPEPPAIDTSIADFEKLQLGESDIVLLTTRPPMDDDEDGWKSHCASNSELERDVFAALEKCVHYCSRKEVELQKSIGRNLQEGYQNRLHIEFEVVGQQASYTGIYHGKAKNYEPWTENMSAGYLIHVPLGPSKPRLLAVFGMSGTMTLLWTYLLSKHHEVLQQALTAPSFTMAEMVRTSPIPHEKDTMKPFNFNFCDEWDLKIIGQCKLILK